MSIVFINHPGRPDYERDWLSRALGDGLVRIIDGQSSTVSKPTDIVLAVEDCLLSRGFGSTASLTRFREFDNALTNVSVSSMVSIEVFSSSSSQARRFASKVGVPHFIVVYELLSRHPIYRLPPYRYMTRRVRGSMALCIAVTQMSADHLVELGFRHSQVTVCNPGVDVDVFHPAVDAVESQKLLFVGRFAPHKGVCEVVQAFVALLPRFPSLTLTLVGSGPLEPWLREMAAKHGGLCVLGQVGREELSEIYRRHSILLAPSVDTTRFGVRIGAEQLSFAILEGMASGLAVVGSDCGAIPEVLGSSDYIVAQRDVVGIADRVAELCSDVGRLGAVQEFNRRRVSEHYNLQIQASRFAELVSPR